MLKERQDKEYKVQAVKLIKKIGIKNNLNIYNSIRGVQKTSCLVYAMLTQKHPS